MCYYTYKIIVVNKLIRVTAHSEYRHFSAMSVCLKIPLEKTQIPPTKLTN